jgi:hypothetical protein
MSTHANIVGTLVVAKVEVVIASTVKDGGEIFLEGGWVACMKVLKSARGQNFI